MAKVGGPVRGNPVLTAVAPIAGTVNLKEGEPVKFSGSYEVRHPGDGEEIHGQVLDKLVKSDNALVAVVTRGNLRFSYTGAAPTPGLSVAGSATAGKVKAAATGRAVVVGIDTAKTTVDVLL